jgi:hypothetical protein
MDIDHISQASSASIHGLVFCGLVVGPQEVDCGQEADGLRICRGTTSPTPRSRPSPSRWSGNRTRKPKRNETKAEVEGKSNREAVAIEKADDSFERETRNDLINGQGGFRKLIPSRN